MRAIAYDQYGRNGRIVAEAMAAVPRAQFLPRSARRRAGEDRPVGIGHDQTNSQPSTVAAMLRLLAVEPGQHVLDLGTGSGWTAALLAELVGRTGSVVGVERVPELVERAREAVADLPHVDIRPARDVLGAPESAPFARILVSAEAMTLPEELVDQLAPGGVMVIPVNGRMLRVHVPAEAVSVSVSEHGRYRFVPLITPTV
ncbi:MAG: methyltransferase domain-containing protein [Ornithinimicrobium sp.]